MQRAPVQTGCPGVAGPLSARRAGSHCSARHARAWRCARGVRAQAEPAPGTAAAATSSDEQNRRLDDLLAERGRAARRLAAAEAALSARLQEEQRENAEGNQGGGDLQDFGCVHSGSCRHRWWGS